MSSRAVLPRVDLGTPEKARRMARRGARASGVSWVLERAASSTGGVARGIHLRRRRDVVMPVAPCHAGLIHARLVGQVVLTGLRLLREVELTLAGLASRLKLRCGFTDCRQDLRCAQKHSRMHSTNACFDRLSCRGSRQEKASRLTRYVGMIGIDTSSIRRCPVMTSHRVLLTLD
jgi:hypothetical protein